MRIALGQINPTVGDFSGNLALMIRYAREAAGRRAEVVVFPELSVTGYPPRDLVEKPSFIDRSEAAVQELARATADLPLAVIAGYVGRAGEHAGRLSGKPATNSAAVLKGGQAV